MEFAEKRRIRIARKIVFAGLAAMLFLLLGLFGGVGYRLYSLKELGFVPHSRLGYADARFKCDILYSPLLYPVYWIMGRGHTNGTFSILYFAEGYTAGEHAAPIFGLGEKDRRDVYLMNMLMWGLSLNLFVLFSLTLAIEIVGQRGLYLVLFGGVVGFMASEILGVFVGMVAGSIVALIFLKLWPNNPILVFWRSLWNEKVPSSENRLH